MAGTDLTRPAPVPYTPLRPTLAYSGPPLTNMALRHELGDTWDGGHIYIFWGYDESPLYVGMSVNAPSRFDKHRRRGWWLFVTAVDIYYLPRLEGEKGWEFTERLHRFEMAAIEGLRPTENIAGVA